MSFVDPSAIMLDIHTSTLPSSPSLIWIPELFNSSFWGKSVVVWRLLEYSLCVLKRVGHWASSMQPLLSVMGDILLAVHCSLMISFVR
jgi:hypothetical protein